jgi:hypothetical protein
MNFPKNYFFKLTLKNPQKAAALSIFVNLIQFNAPPTSRKFAEMLGMGKTQAAEWIREFKLEIEKTGQKTGGVKAENTEEMGKLKRQRADKMRANDPKKSNEKRQPSEVSSLKPANNLLPTCKRAPLKGVSSNTHANGSSGRRIQDIREFQNFLRKNWKPNNVQIKLKNGLSLQLSQGLLAASGKILSSRQALIAWNELYEKREEIEAAIKNEIPKDCVRSGRYLTRLSVLIEGAGIVIKAVENGEEIQFNPVSADRYREIIKELGC